MGNQNIYNTINQIMDVIDQLGATPVAKSTKSESIKRKFIDKGVGLYEVTMHEKAYVLAKSIDEARKVADLLSDFGDSAGVQTHVGINKVQSAEDISDLVSKDRRPVVPVISDNGGSYAPCLYTLNELLPEMFPSKEKTELEQKLNEARAKVQAANQEYYKLYEQFKGSK